MPAASGQIEEPVDTFRSKLMRAIVAFILLLGSLAILAGLPRFDNYDPAGVGDFFKTIFFCFAIVMMVVSVRIVRRK